MYGKHFASTYTGSMVGAGLNVFAVWGYVIANTVKSRVELNPKLLCMILGCLSEEVSSAISFLCREDDDSRSKDDNGCRLVKEGQFQYFVPTHEYYNSIRNEDERREYNRGKKAEERARNKAVVKEHVIDMSALSAHTEAEAEAEAEAVKKEEPLPGTSEEPRPRRRVNNPDTPKPDPLSKYEILAGMIEELQDAICEAHPSAKKPVEGSPAWYEARLTMARLVNLDGHPQELISEALGWVFHEEDQARDFSWRRQVCAIPPLRHKCKNGLTKMACIIEAMNRADAKSAKGTEYGPNVKTDGPENGYVDESTLLKWENEHQERLRKKAEKQKENAQDVRTQD